MPHFRDGLSDSGQTSSCSIKPHIKDGLSDSRANLVMFDKATLQGHTIGTPKCTHLIQRPCYHRGSPCKDPAGNRTTRRPPDHRKETQTAVVWPCLPFIRSGQNHPARHSERGKKTRQTQKEVGKQSGTGQAWSSPSPRRQWRTGENEGYCLRNRLWCPNDSRG